MPPLQFQGARLFRQRLVCATLAGKAMRVEAIHEDDAKPGLRAHEDSFLRLLEKISNGCVIQINETGTSFFYRPGVLCGGAITHDCSGCGRGAGYFVEGVACLAPFCKEPLALTLTGVVTNDNTDLSVDLLRAVLLPNLARFGLDEGLDLRIEARGAEPAGGGRVVFTCPAVRALHPIQLVDDGLVRRVRGVAYCTRMSPQAANRAVEGARSVLNRFARDVFIFTDFRKGPEGGASPGFAIALVAETTTGCLLSAEVAGVAGDVPEDVGKRAAEALVAEVAARGCVDTAGQWTALLMMLLAPEDVSRLRLGRLSRLTIDCLRLYRDIFGVTFKVTPDPETNTVLLSCLGVGFLNFARRIY